MEFSHMSAIEHIRNQHWFRWCIGDIRQQAIIWANVDPDLCHHLVSLGHNEWIGWNILATMADEFVLHTRVVFEELHFWPV